MKTVAEVIGVSRSNLVERLQERPKKRIGRPPLPDDELVAEIEAVIAELPTYGYRQSPAAHHRMALRQWQLLRCWRYPQLRSRHRSRTENHAHRKSTKQWNGRGLRTHDQA